MKSNRQDSGNLVVKSFLEERYIDVSWKCVTMTK